MAPACDCLRVASGAATFVCLPKGLPYAQCCFDGLPTSMHSPVADVAEALMEIDPCEAVQTLAEHCKARFVSCRTLRTAYLRSHSP